MKVVCSFTRRHFGYYCLFVHLITGSDSIPLFTVTCKRREYKTYSIYLLLHSFLETYMYDIFLVSGMVVTDPYSWRNRLKAVHSLLHFSAISVVVVPGYRQRSLSKILSVSSTQLKFLYVHTSLFSMSLCYPYLDLYSSYSVEDCVGN